MLTTAAAVFSAIGLLMPGFIVAELSVARSARGSRSELELALRALSYTLVIHIVFAFWTVHLIAHVGKPHEWTMHWAALTVYGAVVLIGAPALIGSVLNRYLANVERFFRPRVCTSQQLRLRGSIYCRRGHRISLGHEQLRTCSTSRGCA